VEAPRKSGDRKPRAADLLLLLLLFLLLLFIPLLSLLLFLLLLRQPNDPGEQTYLETYTMDR